MDALPHELKAEIINRLESPLFDTMYSRIDVNKEWRATKGEVLRQMSIKLTTINPATIIAQWTGLRSLTLSGPREDLIAHAIIEAAKLPMLESLSIVHKTAKKRKGPPPVLPDPFEWTDEVNPPFHRLTHLSTPSFHTITSCFKSSKFTASDFFPNLKSLAIEAADLVSGIPNSLANLESLSLHSPLFSGIPISQWPDTSGMLFAKLTKLKHLDVFEAPIDELLMLRNQSSLQRGLDKLKALCPSVGVLVHRSFLKTVHFQEYNRTVTILHKAAKTPFVRVVDLIIQYCDGNVNPRDLQGRTPLFYAISTANTLALAKLLAAGGDPTIRDYKHGKTALHVAAKKGCSLDIFKMLWKLMATANPADLPTLLMDYHRKTVVHYLSEGQNVECLQWLMTDPSATSIIKLDPNARDSSGATALFSLPNSEQTFERSLPIVKLLLDVGCNPNLVDDNGVDALYRFLEQGLIYEAIQLLSRPNFVYKPTFDKSSGRTVLHVAVACCVPRLIKLLFAQHPEIAHLLNIPDNNGNTPIVEVIKPTQLFTSAFGDEEMSTFKNMLDGKAGEEHLAQRPSQTARTLIDFGADINASHKSVLSVGINQKWEEDFLTEMIALANVDKADPDLRTPLHCACSSTNVKVIKDLLAKSKSNVNAKDVDGRCPIHCLLSDLRSKPIGRVRESLRALIEAGADVNLPDSFGQYPILSVASQADYLDKIDANQKSEGAWLFEILLAGGANVNGYDDTIDQSPLHYLASKNPPMDMVQIFLDAEDIDMARPDNTGGTYLMAFVNDRARPEIVHAVAKKMTLEQRNVQRDDGDTALHIALPKQSVPVILVLLELGVDPAIKNRSGKTAADMAAIDSRNIVKEINRFIHSQSGRSPTEAHSASFAALQAMMGRLSGEFTGWSLENSSPASLDPPRGTASTSLFGIRSPVRQTSSSSNPFGTFLTPTKTKSAFAPGPALDVFGVGSSPFGTPSATASPASNLFSFSTSGSAPPSPFGAFAPTTTPASFGAAPNPFSISTADNSAPNLTVPSISNDNAEPLEAPAATLPIPWHAAT